MSATKGLDEYLTDCVKIEPLALEEEYIRLPADLAFWNDRYAKAVETYLQAKHDSDTMYAKLLIIHRATLQNQGVKVTESIVEATILQDQKWLDVEQKRIGAEAAKARLSGVLDAVKTKRDMLISLGAHIRAEMERDPQVRERQRGRSLMRDQEG